MSEVPSNLKPHTYKCEKCESLVKYHLATDSYYLVSVPLKGVKSCKFCYSLSKSAIPEHVGIKKDG